MATNVFPLWKAFHKGKTQYALWLAQRLGRDVVLKRPSDLLSKYLGESEQRIAAASTGAARAGSVLVIDEADALLYDRAIAARSWEHSQIAVFLQQIHEFPGFLIACTNRISAADPALRRRFHKHLTSAPIRASVLEAALAHVFPEVSFTEGRGLLEHWIESTLRVASILRVMVRIRSV